MEPDRTDESSLPQRKTPIHQPTRQEINRSTIVFVTVCTDKRKAILCRPEVHELLVESWRQAGAWIVGRYVVMPDHIHLFCAPAEWEGPSLGKWIRFWKSQVSRAWPWPRQQPIWQKSFWDRQVRRSEHYAGKWQYVRNNPVRKGLAAAADDWPFQGELSMLVWEG